ncbi:MAG TPA: TraR/DksA C4-type zinc finger protein [Thermoanaerobaculia bacterium]|nr:TraR/DksA C4-type zinc finger protein [Thermoanaerobaculia bacterium]
MAHLTREQLAHFRQRLATAKAGAEALLSQTAADARPVDVSGSTIGRLTRMDAIQMQAMAQMNRRQLDIRLRQVEAALAALEAGTYGSCRYCRGPIALPRLEALPESPFCIDCQEQLERER